MRLTKKVGNKLLFACKVLTGVTIFALLLGRINYTDLGIAFRQIDLGLFLTGLLFFALAMIFEVGKLFPLLSQTENFFRTTKLVYIGSFFNNFLPSNVGGDAYKILVLGRTHGNWLKWSALVIADRGIGLTLLTIISIVLFCIYPARLLTPFSSLHQLQSLYSQQAIFFLIVAVFILVVVCSLHWRERLIRVCNCLLQGLRSVSAWQYIMAICYSALFHLSRFAGIYFFLQALGSKTAAPEIMVTMGLVAIVSMLPISIGALGVREGAFVVGLGFYGVNFTTATAIAILIRLILWAQAMFGGILLLFNKQKIRKLV